MSEMSFTRGLVTVNYLVVAVKVFLGANASNLSSLFQSLLRDLLVLNFWPSAWLIHYNYH